MLEFLFLYAFVCLLTAIYAQNKFRLPLRIGFGISTALTPLSTLIFVFFLRPKPENFEGTYEDAKEAEYNGQAEVAVLKYKETVAHLENDYEKSPLTDDEEANRLKMIDQIKAKIIELEGQDSHAKSNS